MGTQITITTDDAGLAADLIALINGVGRGALDSTTVEQTPTPAPAKKAAAKKAAAPKPEPVVEEEPEAEDEDLVGGEDETYTMADAVARATELVQAGKADTVKGVLTDLGVAKVSHLKEPQIPEFMSALADA